MKVSLVKSIVVLAMALGSATPAGSQTAKPKPAPDAVKAMKAPHAQASHKSRRNQDARQCLERPSNTEIIKCAEAFL